MEAVFLKLLNMSISAGWIVLMLILFRLIFKKAPKWITALMWTLVGIRLVCPFSFESILSLMPSPETVPSEIVYAKNPTIQSGISIIDNSLNPIISTSFAPDPMASANPLQILLPIAAIFWAVGIAAMLIYAAISVLLIRRKVRESVLIKENIYLCDRVNTPFIFGVIRPKIYLPSNISEQDCEYVIAHEKAHLKRRDHIWKPLAYLLLTVYWFNPLVWVAYILLCRDIEFACDEKVIKQFGEETKKPYSNALVNCSVPRRMITACPLAFGEVGVKSRIKSVLNYKKPAFWVIVAAVIACIVASVSLLTNPVSKNSLDDELISLIESEIDKQHETQYSAENFCCHDFIVLGTKKSGDEISVYMWVLYEEYSFVGELKEETGAHTPTVVTAKKENGGYSLVEYWTPRDGSYYADDIRAKFPMRLWSKALDSQRYIDSQESACRNAALKHFSQTIESSNDSTAMYTPNTALSFANWTDDFIPCLNSDKLTISSAQHLPILKFESLKELNEFKSSYGSVLSMNATLDEVPSFESVTASMDDAFFEKNTLLVIYVAANNSTHRFALESIYAGGSSLCAYIKETTNAETVDTAMAGWFVTITLAKDTTRRYDSFDAVLRQDNTTQTPAVTEPTYVFTAVEGGEYSDVEGVSVSFIEANIDAEKPYIVVNIDNQRDFEFAFGMSFDIEYLENGEYKSAATEELYFNSLAQVLDAGDNFKKTYYIDKFDLTKEGTYRFYVDAFGSRSLYFTFEVTRVD